VDGIAYVESPDHVCCRYRLAAFRPRLEALGHTLELRSLPTTLGGRFQIGRDIPRGTTVIVQRKLLPVWQLFLLRRRVDRLLYDFDDAVWSRDSYASRSLYSGRRLHRFRAMMHACDGVIAGNAFLAAQAAHWLPARAVHIIPTCVDESRYPVAEPSRVGPDVQLVWVGSSSTLQGLEMAREWWDAIGEQVGVSMKVICDRFPTFQHMQINQCDWHPEREFTDLATGDIGVSWIPDDVWSRGKCGLKVLQYMAAGLPVVANPVGVHREMIVDGVTGFWATTPAEWVEAIRVLAHDPDLRQRMGQAGRSRMEAIYSVRAGAAQWAMLLDDNAMSLRRSA